MPVLTVKQLKELLRIIPGETLIWTEGCDCIGPSDSISKLEPVNKYDSRYYQIPEGSFRICINRMK